MAVILFWVNLFWFEWNFRFSCALSKRALIVSIIFIYEIINITFQMLSTGCSKKLRMISECSCLWVWRLSTFITSNDKLIMLLPFFTIIVFCLSGQRSLTYRLYQSLREGSGYQIGWVFGKGGDEQFAIYISENGGRHSGRKSRFLAPLDISDISGYQLGIGCQFVKA